MSRPNITLLLGAEGCSEAAEAPWLREPGKPLATIEIDGRPCVVYGCPSEQ